MSSERSTAMENVMMVNTRECEVERDFAIPPSFVTDRETATASENFKTVPRQAKALTISLIPQLLPSAIATSNAGGVVLPDQPFPNLKELQEPLGFGSPFPAANGSLQVNTPHDPRGNRFLDPTGEALNRDRRSHHNSSSVVEAPAISGQEAGTPEKAACGKAARVKPSFKEKLRMGRISTDSVSLSSTPIGRLRAKGKQLACSPAVSIPDASSVGTAAVLPSSTTHPADNALQWVADVSPRVVGSRAHGGGQAAVASRSSIFSSTESALPVLYPTLPSCRWQLRGGGGVMDDTASPSYLPVEHFAEPHFYSRGVRSPQANVAHSRSTQLQLVDNALSSNTPKCSIMHAFTEHPMRAFSLGMEEAGRSASAGEEWRQGSSTSTLTSRQRSGDDSPLACSRKDLYDRDDRLSSLACTQTPTGCRHRGGGEEPFVAAPTLLDLPLPLRACEETGACESWRARAATTLGDGDSLEQVPQGPPHFSERLPHSGGGQEATTCDCGGVTLTHSHNCGQEKKVEPLGFPVHAVLVPSVAEDNAAVSGAVVPVSSARRDRGKILLPQNTAMPGLFLGSPRGAQLAAVGSPGLRRQGDFAHTVSQQPELIVYPATGSFGADEGNEAPPLSSRSVSRGESTLSSGTLALRAHSVVGVTTPKTSSGTDSGADHATAPSRIGSQLILCDYPALVATKDNRRMSSFSSLQFSMKRRKAKQAEGSRARKRHSNSTSLNLEDLGDRSKAGLRVSLPLEGSPLDDASNMKVRWDGSEEGMEEVAYSALLGFVPEDEDDALPRGVGMWETVEHIFIPRYERLEGGEGAGPSLAQCSLRAADPSWSASFPSPTGLAAGLGTFFLPCQRSQSMPVPPPALVPGISKLSTGTGSTEGVSSPPTVCKNSLHTARTGPSSPKLHAFSCVSSPELRPGPYRPPEQCHRFSLASAAAGVFSFGRVAKSYNTKPADEDPQADCKVVARLVFDTDRGVMLLSPQDEVDRYARRTLPTLAGGGQEGAGAEGDADDGACACDEAFITKDCRGTDFSRYSAHELYAYCAVCGRRPAAFLCLHCFQAVCPSHVRRHHRRQPAACVLFLNVLDIMTSYDRIFWCERCRRFTWKYTETYEPLVNQIAYTRGTYLNEAVRDIHCFGLEAQLQAEEGGGSQSDLLSPASGAAEGQQQSLQSQGSLSVSSGAELRTPRVPAAAADRCTYRVSPMHELLFRDSVNLSEGNVVPVGEAVSKLVAIGASAQGWRSTQEDAETAFLVNIPALRAEAVDGRRGKKAAPAPATVAAGRPEKKIPMAVFCVFDGHGGDAVAKLAASHFERHLRRAIAEARQDDIHARALLFHLNTQSSPRQRPFTTPQHSPFHAYSLYASNQLTPPCSFALPPPPPQQQQQPPGPDGSPFSRGRLFSGPLLLPPRLSLSGSPPSVLLCGVPTMFECDRLAGEAELPTEDATTVVPITAATLAQHVASDRGHRPGLADASSTSRAGFSCHFVKPMHPSTLVRAWEEASLLESAPAKRVSLSFATPSALVTVSEVEMLRSYFASIMEDALLSLDEYLRKTPEGVRGDYNCVGCTACVVGITSNFVLCANVGDSGAAFYTRDAMETISVTHRLSDPKERARITAAGYTIEKERIEGMLAVPRALGDFDFKQCGGRSAREQAVTAVPDVTIRPVPSDTDYWGVVVACDGVWDTATLRQVHHALVNTPNDLDVATSATEAVLRAKDLVERRRRGLVSLAGKSAAVHAFDALPRSQSLLAQDARSLPGDRYNSRNPLGDEDGGTRASASLAMDDGTNQSESSWGGEHLAGDGGMARGLDPRLLTSAAGVFAQCIAPMDNEEGIGLDNCSLIIIERRT